MNEWTTAAVSAEEAVAEIRSGARVSARIRKNACVVALNSGLEVDHLFRHRRPEHPDFRAELRRSLVNTRHFDRSIP